MGNQQERLAQLGYLAGIIDGEGWVGLSKQTHKENRCGYSLRPIVCAHMVGPDYVDNLGRICDDLGVAHHIAHYKVSSRWGVYGLKRVEKLLEVVEPFLFIKRRQAQLLQRYIELRKLRHHHSNPSDEEELIRVAIGQLNTKGKNPQRLYAERT